MSTTSSSSMASTKVCTLAALQFTTPTADVHLQPSPTAKFPQTSRLTLRSTPHSLQNPSTHPPRSFLLKDRRLSVT
jgi:hypothetical protein